MKKKIICTILVTVLVVTAFTGCGKKQDTDTVDVVSSETETKDSNLTTEVQEQAAVNTLLPTASPKPVVTETATPAPMPVATKAPTGTATTAKPTTTPMPTATSTPTATTTSKPVNMTGTTVASNTTGKTETTVKEASKETPAATAKPVPTTAPTPVPTPAPCNHNYVKEYWPAAPDCNGGGDWTMVCSICGAVGATGTDLALPHTPETRVEVDATYCDEHGVRVTYCTSCGNELGREGFDGTEHEWTTGTYEAWDEDTHTVVEKERTYCSRCGVSQ